MNNELEFFKNNPPRCLDNFKATSVDAKNIVFDGHGQEVNPFFEIKCKCGSENLSVLGYWWENPDNKLNFFIGPISLKCVECSEENDLFDIKYHGYDAELGHGYYSARGEGVKKLFECEACNSNNFKLLTRFEYTEFKDDFPEAKGKEKELFTWFSLHGECSSCNSSVQIYEDECA
ncbi:MAG: hypothetical protein HWE11_05350 [Gammaproteobacteria bacterium]|nr:hypothetical protein [Gammaproteobacteria bacterium]